MPVNVTRIENEPIILAQLSGKISVDDVREVFRQSQPLLDQIEGRVFRITDVREATSTFAEIMNGIKEAAGGSAGTTSDPRLTIVFVGNNQWVQLYRSAMFLKQFGGKEIPLFPTMEEAMHFIRLQMETSE